MAIRSSPISILPWVRARFWACAARTARAKGRGHGVHVRDFADSVDDVFGVLRKTGGQGVAIGVGPGTERPRLGPEVR